MYEGNKEWEGTNREIIFSKNQRLNDFIFASEFLRDAKDMRMLEETGKISNDRNMEELLGKDAPTLVPPPNGE
jgi:phospholipid/cholesterol/gamma-HCH transport system ATP-binding protein